MIFKLAPPPTSLAQVLSLYRGADSLKVTVIVPFAGLPAFSWCGGYCYRTWHEVSDGITSLQPYAIHQDWNYTRQVRAKDCSPVGSFISFFRSP